MSELLVIVTIGGRRCALRAVDVESVIELGFVNAIPRAPAHFRGMSALRSQALTVINCRKAIGCDSEEFVSDLRAPVVNVDGHLYALLVDEVDDISEGHRTAEDVTGGFGAEWDRVARAMVETAEGPALLLDPAALIEGPESRDEAA